MAERMLDVTDPRALRALAHPVRLRLLQLVREHRPVTNAELAALTGESTANVSYHMSVLVRHGFVEADPEPGATRRHKPWRTTYDRMRMHPGESGSTPLESPGGGVLAIAACRFPGRAGRLPRRCDRAGGDRRPTLRCSC